MFNFLFRRPDGVIRDFVGNGEIPSKKGMAGTITIVPVLTHGLYGVVASHGEFAISLNLSISETSGMKEMRRSLSNKQYRALMADLWAQELKYGRVVRFPEF